MEKEEESGQLAEKQEVKLDDQQNDKLKRNILLGLTLLSIGLIFIPFSVLSAFYGAMLCFSSFILVAVGIAISTVSKMKMEGYEEAKRKRNRTVGLSSFVVSLALIPVAFLSTIMISGIACFSSLVFLVLGIVIVVTNRKRKGPSWQEISKEVTGKEITSKEAVSESKERLHRAGIRKRPIKAYVFWGIVALLILSMSYNAFYGSERPLIDMDSVPVEVTETNETITNVALVQSTKEDVADITEEDVREMVREAVELAGGLEGIVKDGDTVVLKPNFMAATHMAGNVFALTFDALGSMEGDYPDSRLLSQTGNGLSTDYRVAKAVSELVREINPNGTIHIMEASGSGNTDKIMETLGYTHENLPEIDAFISMDDAGKNYTETTDYLVAVDLGEYRLYEKDRGLAHTNSIYYMDKQYYSADVLISLPTLKNHQMAAVTGAIKNVAIGSTPPGIYGGGLLGEGSPNRGAIDHSWDQLNAFIHDYYLVKPIDFVVTDGLQGLQYGPLAAGAEEFKDAQMNMRLILAGRDALAVDTVHALITGVDPQEVDYFRFLAKDNVGIMNTSRIHVSGNVKVDDIHEQFKFPGVPYSWMNPVPHTCVYKDFKDPVVTVEDFKVTDNSTTAQLISNERLVKLEIYIDGVYVDTVLEQGKAITMIYENEAIGPGSDIDIYAYDRFLNCVEIDTP